MGNGKNPYTKNGMQNYKNSRPYQITCFASLGMKNEK